MSDSGKKLFTAVNMAYIALMAALIAVCAWISVPAGDVPFTLQTFGVFCALSLLGGKRGTLAVALYLLLGAVGLPVFSGFSGGLGRLAGPTGGYLLGFLFAGLVYWLITGLLGSGLRTRVAALVLGCAVYYAFGTAWYALVYAPGSGPAGFAAAMAKCVLPYIVPDLLKLALALYLTHRLKNRLPNL